MQQTALEHITEIIIVNDGSSDGTPMVMEKLKDTYKVMSFILINQENTGVSRARNAGLREASGDWIALLDADDEWDCNKIKRQVDTIIEHPEIDFLGCGHNDLKLRILWKKIDILYHASVKDLCLKSFPVTPSFLFRKSILKEIGYFDESRKYMEDSDFCLRVAEHYNFYYLPESLVTIGHGKKAVGESGLSANVKGMYLGLARNMKDLRKRGTISYSFFVIVRIFHFMKYIRRKILVLLKR